MGILVTTLTRTAGVLFCLCVVLTCASCTSLALMPYRDNELLDQYSYALGEKYITVNGLKICYQEMGEGETVLVVPGLGMSADYWQLNVPAFAAENHVVAVDFPGIGKSDKPDVEYELSWIADQIVAFMDAKGIDRAAVVGGSMGGHIALLMALDHPDRVSKLVLMGSVGTWAPPDFWMDLGFKTLWWDINITDILRRRWPDIYDRIFKYKTPFTEYMLRYEMALRANGSRYAPHGRAASRMLVSIFYSSCRHRLAEIKCPVLLVWGSEDQVHTVKEVGMFFREHLADSRLVVVDDAAHEVMIDQPEAFNSLVCTFLKSGTRTIADRIPAPDEHPGDFEVLQAQKWARDRGS